MIDTLNLVDIPYTAASPFIAITFIYYALIFHILMYKNFLVGHIKIIVARLENK